MLRDPNSSSHTGDKLDRTPDVPEGSGTALSPSWRCAFCTPCRCTFSWSQEGSSWKYQLRDTAGERRSPCSAVGSMEVPKEPAMASEGSEGRGTSCDVATSSFGATDIVVGACPPGEGACWPSTLEKGALEEGGADLPDFRTWAVMRSTNQLTKGTCHGQLQLLSSLLLQAGCISFWLCYLPQLPQDLQKKEKMEINVNPEEDQLEIKFKR